MSDQTLLYIVIASAFIFCALWIFNSKQKRKHEEARRQRKLELQQLKDKAREK